MRKAFTKRAPRSAASSSSLGSLECISNAKPANSNAWRPASRQSIVGGGHAASLARVARAHCQQWRVVFAANRYSFGPSEWRPPHAHLAKRDFDRRTLPQPRRHRPFPTSASSSSKWATTSSAHECRWTSARLSPTASFIGGVSCVAGGNAGIMRRPLLRARGPSRGGLDINANHLKSASKAG